MSVDRKTPLQGHHPVSGPRRCASPATKPCSCAAMPTKSAELGSHTGSPRCRDMTHVGHCKVVQSQAQGIETKHSVAEILGASSKKAVPRSFLSSPSGVAPVLAGSIKEFQDAIYDRRQKQYCSRVGRRLQTTPCLTGSHAHAGTSSKLQVDRGPQHRERLGRSGRESPQINRIGSPPPFTWVAQHEAFRHGAFSPHRKRNAIA